MHQPLYQTCNIECMKKCTQSDDLQEKIKKGDPLSAKPPHMTIEMRRAWHISQIKNLLFLSWVTLLCFPKTFVGQCILVQGTLKLPGMVCNSPEQLETSLHVKSYLTSNWLLTLIALNLTNLVLVLCVLCLTPEHKMLTMIMLTLN